MDFRSVSGGTVALFDGESSGVISVQLMEDEVPEVDEVFLVNLTRVELVEPRTSTFMPKLGQSREHSLKFYIIFDYFIDKIITHLRIFLSATSGTIAEVVINANDGTQGEVHFSPQSAR